METINLGSWKIPTSWKEITLRDYQRLENEEDKTNLEKIIAILSNKSVDEVYKLPVDFLNIILAKLSFILEQPEYDKPSDGITINGERYFIRIGEKLKTGEYLAVDNLLKSDPNNYSAMLAILCRKENEEFDTNYEKNIFPEREKLFSELSIVDIMPLIGFFLTRLGLSKITSLLYSEVGETLGDIQKSIETSRKSGALTGLSLQSAKRTLKGLKRLYSGI